jgi:hypothetical protein
MGTPYFNEKYVSEITAGMVTDSNTCIVDHPATSKVPFFFF